MQLYEPTLSSVSAKILGAGCTQAVVRNRCPQLAMGIRYALLPALDYPAKPYGFPSLAGLARRIQRDRGRDALQLLPARLRFQDQVRDVVEVLAQDVGGRTRRIGFAWIAGQDWRALQAALEAQTPSAQVGEAA